MTKFKAVTLITVLFTIPSMAFAGISRNNYVDWVVVSSSASGGGNFIQWKNSFDNSDCTVTGAGNARTRLSADDKSLLSLFLTAKAANKKVGLYYSTSTSIPRAAGHGLESCQITNAWLETD